MRVIVTGSRNWVDGSLIRMASVVHGVTEVIEGECRGADRLARDAAKALGLKIHPRPADWDKLGRAAGPFRNQEMLELGLELGLDAVLAFHDSLELSTGTLNMTNIARMAGVPVYLYSHRRRNDGPKGLLMDSI